MSRILRLVMICGFIINAFYGLWQGLGQDKWTEGTFYLVLGLVMLHMPTDDGVDAL